tara:strand:- start:1529 stop:2542 length:1014 start_codon:yes stop_codon:yes gene_type:complete
MALPRKVLIIQTAFIGDAILATSLLESWHHVHPGDELHFLVRSGNESLLDFHPFLAGLHTWKKSSNAGLRYWNLVALGIDLRRMNFDVVVTPHRHISSGILMLMSGAKQRMGFSSHPFSMAFTHSQDHGLGNGEHEIERNHRLIADDVALLEPKKPRLYPAQKIDNQGWSEKFGVAAPSSQWATKQWPSSRWIEWLDLEFGIAPEQTIVLIGAPSDRAELELIANQSKHELLEIRTDLSLLGAVGLMRGAMWVVTNDSGPMHMASSVDVPTVAIFCSTLPSFGFGPLASQSVVVEVEMKLDCRPCGLHGHQACPLSHFNCGHGITAGQVAAAVKALA